MIGIEGILTASSVSLLTALGGWLIGKRKQNAEASLIEVKAINAIREFYESALNDTKNQLQHYISVTELNRKEIEAQRVQLQEMKTLVEALLDKTCNVENCPKRRILQTASLQFLKMKHNEQGKKDIQIVEEDI